MTDNNGFDIGKAAQDIANTILRVPAAAYGALSDIFGGRLGLPTARASFAPLSAPTPSPSTSTTPPLPVAPKLIAVRPGPRGELKGTVFATAAIPTTAPQPAPLNPTGGLYANSFSVGNAAVDPRYAAPPAAPPSPPSLTSIRLAAVNLESRQEASKQADARVTKKAQVASLTAESLKALPSDPTRARTLAEQAQTMQDELDASDPNSYCDRSF
jgi:hypothetical protein